MILPLAVGCSSKPQRKLPHLRDPGIDFWKLSSSYRLKTLALLLSVYQDCTIRKDEIDKKTETSTNSKKGAHPKSWKVLKYMEKDRDKDKHRSPPLNIVQLKVWQRGLYGGWGGLEGKLFWQLEASSPWKII